ncbi:MAG: pyridoxal-phosphate-dependent aminotransferase family protein [Candidatus Natronoplasma sp.]
MMMTPGPTELPHTVKEAIARTIENPDIQEEFFDFYHLLENDLQELYDTEDDIVILGGEGILGLEASIASLIDEGDKVLCISNGIFGDGFANFVEMYGGEAVMCEFPYDQPMVLEKVEEYLDQHDFKAATMVHCETPTGTLNDLEPILKRLKEENILTVVDAVSSVGGVPVPVEHMDICIAGSQKCLSSPPGLTTLSVSEEAWRCITEGGRGDRHFYTSLKVWKKEWLEEEHFPYTPLVSNLYALKESVELILEEGLPYVYARHEESAKICRERGKQMGLKLFPKQADLCSNTVTAFRVPGKARQIQKEMREKHDILLATGLAGLKDDIIRVGHMGFNAKREKVKKTMDALEKVLR